MEREQLEPRLVQLIAGLRQHQVAEAVRLLLDHIDVKMAERTDVETVKLKAGTVLRYRGMPLELRADTVVNMRHANKAAADDATASCVGVEYVFADSDQRFSLGSGAQRDTAANWAALKYPFGEGTRSAIQAGDPKAMAKGMASLAAHLLGCAGVHHVAGIEVTRSMMLAVRSQQSSAMVAAALDIIDVLRLAAVGQEALADLFGQPGFQKIKGE